jgi:hypothetical protein
MRTIEDYPSQPPVGTKTVTLRFEKGFGPGNPVWVRQEFRSLSAEEITNLISDLTQALEYRIGIERQWREDAN